MDVSEATRTVGRYPVRIYATNVDDLGRVPGLIWIYGQRWEIAVWESNGRNIHPYFLGFDLDLTDWRDKIHWECLRGEINWVFWSMGNWYGTVIEPEPGMNGWLPYASPCWMLSGIKMPDPPADWREAIAHRPK